MGSTISDTVGYAIAQLCKAHRYAIDASFRCLPDADLRVGQEMLLLQLWESDGLTQSQLVERLKVEPPTVTTMLQRMESRGLVERHPDPEDARVSRVFLTPRGRALEVQVEAQWLAVETRAVAGLSVEERLLLRRLLIQVRHNLTHDAQ